MEESGSPPMCLNYVDEVEKSEKEEILPSTSMKCHCGYSLAFTPCKTEKHPEGFFSCSKKSSVCCDGEWKTTGGCRIWVDSREIDEMEPSYKAEALCACLKPFKLVDLSTPKFPDGFYCCPSAKRNEEGQWEDGCGTVFGVEDLNKNPTCYCGVRTFRNKMGIYFCGKLGSAKCSIYKNNYAK